VIDPMGHALDGRPLLRGAEPRPLRGVPMNPTERRVLGERLETGLAVFNTLLPIVRGQRIGLFSGSGVGKSTLLAKLARGVHADVVVIAMIGERGREVREFIERVLGPEGMARAVVVAATSDQSPLVRRRCGWTAMAVAEHFRDQGRQVLFLADSVTRFAEAHREIALAAGEGAALRGFPPSTAHQITALCERAGTGTGTAGDITAVFSVLVSGSDMEEPVADILRGVLDGHVVLDRKIAERGRFPAIDLLRSVSRALPGAASEAENTLISAARQRLGAYDRSEMMIRAGLYATGSDPVLDVAIESFPKLDGFLAEDERENVAASFRRLAECLKVDAAAG
jgi:flagellum-specific ATP synthase